MRLAQRRSKQTFGSLGGFQEKGQGHAFELAGRADSACSRKGLTTFGDKKSEVNAVDEYDLLSYTLSDFTVKSTGPNSAVVTYIAQYEGKSGGENLKAKSVFGEVWIRAGSDWKALYMQETYVK